MEKLYSRKNKMLMHAKKLGKDRSYREEHGEFLCDGMKLLEEAAKSNASIISVFTAKPLALPLPENTKIYQADIEILESISPLKNSQDVVFTCKMPKQEATDYTTGTHILLDNVQDPGNIGTILRSADAFGIDRVLLYGKCADPYNSKTIRASMGAIFKVKINTVTLQQLSDEKLKLIGTGTGSEYTKLQNAELKNRIIVLGNEGQGISDEVKELCSEFITIPIRTGCESLNVAIAASIIMWEAVGS